MGDNFTQLELGSEMGTTLALAELQRQGAPNSDSNLVMLAFDSDSSASRGIIDCLNLFASGSTQGRSQGVVHSEQRLISSREIGHFPFGQQQPLDESHLSSIVCVHIHQFHS